MRTSAFTATVLALAALVNTVSAGDDFSALLADLSFGDAPAPVEPLAVAEEEKLAELTPVPTGLSLPGMVESTPLVEVARVPVEVLPLETLPVEVPQVALQSPIASNPVPEIDLEAAFALQDAVISDAAAPSQPVGHIHNQFLGRNCDAEIVCRPRVRPNLPNSTLLQYFRGSPCYSNVWDGYRYQCCDGHKHIHGECDCFKGKHSDCGNCATGCDK